MDPASQLRRLAPIDGTDSPVSGCYLRHRLHERGTWGKPFVYTNFIASLDGRISWKNPQGFREVPPACSNAHDQRLYHELAAQADILVTSSRHLRAVAAGRGTGMLTLGPHSAELKAWRLANGLPAQPQLAVVSAGLELPPRDRLSDIAGDITVLTWGAPDAHHLSEARDRGYKVRICGEGPHIDGEQLLDVLPPARTVYSVAGPKVMTALLRAARVDRIYLTLVPLLLASEEFDTLTEGDPLLPPPCYELSELWLDQSEPQACGQLFAVFDHATRPGNQAQK
jgi:riboflavin biosynthesis pyrimidine reductase